MRNTKINPAAFITAGLAGLAGGAALGASFGLAGSILSSIAGAVITGIAAYNSEKRKLHSRTAS